MLLKLLSIVSATIAGIVFFWLLPVKLVSRLFDWIGLLFLIT